jgi:hypothetical protein
MRAILILGTLALLGLSAPAGAQMMCGPQQAQTSSAAQSKGMMGGGMMCGMMSQRPADDPSADKPQPPQQNMTMCPCCRNMAKMQGGQGGHH